jgi:putative transposase
MLFSFLYWLACRLLGRRHRVDGERDIEILVLRHQLQVLRRQVKRPQLSRFDRLLLAAASQRMQKSLWSAFIVKPETLLRWHRELVRRKWTFRRRQGAGRPGLERETTELMLHLARENPRWGYQRIRGELLKLDVRVSATTIRTVLLRHGVETVLLKTLYVLFFIELATRRVVIAGATRSPDSAWVTQHARNLAMEGRLEAVCFVLHDRDAKFSRPFDTVLQTEGASVIRTPIRAPKANAFAERFVRTVRSECLDHVLIWGRRHLELVLRTYVRHYIEERPHRGLALATPAGQEVARATRGKMLSRRDVLGGLIHEYAWAA